MKSDGDKKEKSTEKLNERWNNVHDYYEKEKIKADDWLELFDNAIKNCKTPIIDLGCGGGNDTLYLIEKGKEVIPCDYSNDAMESIKNNFPELERVECFDMSKGFPFEDNLTDIIISDLSLHYFTKQKTFEILEEIKRVLKPNGLLLFRVNSINDINYGAKEGIEIETHLYETDGGRYRYKRFFDEKDIEMFFETFEKLYIREEKIIRYGAEKVLWRGAVRVNK